MRFPEMRPRQPLMGVALAAVLGITLADWWVIDWRWLLLAAALCAAVTIWRPRAWLCWVLAGVGFATLHTMRHHHGEGGQLARYLASGPRTVLATGVVCSEPVETKTWGRFPGARFQLRLESIEIDGVVRNFHTTVNVRWQGLPPMYGDRVEVLGAGQNIAPARNPGQFDFLAYAKRQGIYSEVSARYASDCKVLGYNRGNPVYAFALKARQWMRAQLALDLENEPTIADLVASMVLGLRGETPDDVQELFRITGTLHLFAVSGLNVAMLAAITWRLLKPLRISRRASIFVTIPIIAFYAVITGLSASCIRAAIMGSLVLAGLLFDRPPSLFNSLAAAALLIFAWDTNQLFLPGFQFSFVLVLAIAWMAERLKNRIEPFGRPDEFLPRPLWNWRQRAQVWSWNVFASAFGVTMASWLGSLAFTAGYFHLFSPTSILANLVAVPIAFAILALGLFAVLTAPLSGFLAMLFNNANWACAKLLLLSVEVFAHLPGGHTYVETPRSFFAKPAVELTVFDLRDGGAIHLRSGSENWLIDCGHRFEYERIVLPYLRSRGVNRLDAFILTHGDARHIGAAQDVWRELNPVALFDSALKDRSQTRRQLHKALAEQQRGKRLLSRGDTAEVTGPVRLEVLYPPTGISRSVADDKALVLRLTVAGRRVLLMSDSGFATERWLMENEPDLSADVLVKGWHSKDLSGTTDFLSRVRPQVIIANATNAPEALDPLTIWSAQQSAALFHQEETGAVQVAIRHNGNLTIKATVTDRTFRSDSPASSSAGAPSGSAVPD